MHDGLVIEAYDLVIKLNRFVVEPDGLPITPADLVGEPDGFVITLDGLVVAPDRFVVMPDGLLITPADLVGEPESCRSGVPVGGGNNFQPDDY